MSVQANGSPFEYKVEISGFIKPKIKELAKQAASIGQQQAYFDAGSRLRNAFKASPSGSANATITCRRASYAVISGSLGP